MMIGFFSPPSLLLFSHFHMHNYSPHARRSRRRRRGSRHGFRRRISQEVDDGEVGAIALEGGDGALRDQATPADLEALEFRAAAGDVEDAPVGDQAVAAQKERLEVGALVRDRRERRVRAVRQPRQRQAPQLPARRARRRRHARVGEQGAAGEQELPQAKAPLRGAAAAIIAAVVTAAIAAAIVAAVVSFAAEREEGPVREAQLRGEIERNETSP